MDAFDEFLARKKIDAQGFKAAMPARYKAAQLAFRTAGSAATDYAKKFQWNDLRLEFPMQAENPNKE